MFDHGPPALMSMPPSHHENNNNNNQQQHDDYRNFHQVEKPFDLNMVTNEIPYYDLPAGLMCLLVKVSVRLTCLSYSQWLV